MKADHDDSKANKKSANGVQTASRTSQAYWLPRLRKRAGLYGIQVKFKGRRHYLTLNQDRHGSASKAAAIYARLLSEGWDPVLSDHSRIDRTPETVKDAAKVTLGDYITAAGKTLNSAKVTPRTMENYHRAVRMIAAEIADLERSKARFAASKGAKLWRASVDEIPLVELTEARLRAWATARIAATEGNPAAKQRALTSLSAYLARARGFFGPKFTKQIAKDGLLNLPSPIPFAEADLSELEKPDRKRMRYVSRIDPQTVLSRAMAELDAEPLKILCLALCAGLRRAEIDGLRWSQIDFSDGKIIVATTEDFGTKTADSEGAVELDAGFLELLRGWKAGATGPFVLRGDPSPIKQRWTGALRAGKHFESLNAWLRNLEIAGERPLANANKPLHTCRKEAGSRINQLFGLAAAQTFLRHGDITTTARFYTAKKERHTVGFFATPENVTPIHPEPRAARRG